VISPLCHAMTILCSAILCICIYVAMFFLLMKMFCDMCNVRSCLIFLPQDIPEGLLEMGCSWNQQLGRQ